MHIFLVRSHSGRHNSHRWFVPCSSSGLPLQEAWSNLGMKSWHTIHTEKSLNICTETEKQQHSIFRKRSVCMIKEPPGHGFASRCILLWMLSADFDPMACIVFLEWALNAMSWQLDGVGAHIVDKGWAVSHSSCNPTNRKLRKWKQYPPPTVRN